MLTRLLIALTLITIAICFIFADVIQAALWWIAMIGALFLAGAGVITLLMGAMRVLGAFEDWQDKRAGRHLTKAQVTKAQNEALVMVVTNGAQTFIRDLNHNAMWRQAHLDARLYANGHQTEVLADEQKRWNIFNSPKQIGAGQVTQLTTDEVDKPIELLPLLDRAERVLIKGASDGGKTTLLQHAATRSQNVIIVDPHYKPGIWPDNAKILGAGRNFSEIISFFDWLISELISRYEQRAKGNENWTHYTVLIDEFMSINEGCDNAGKTLSTMIRESRKVGFRIFIGSHSELVKPLGLEGAGDVRDGLLIVRLEYDQITQERESTLDYGRGKRPCYFPPFYGNLAIGSGMPEIVIPDMVLSAKVGQREAKIIELIQQGANNKEIAQEVFEKSSLSGDNFYLVKNLRRRLSLDDDGHLDSA